jgi:hypothetical protein
MLTGAKRLRILRPIKPVQLTILVLDDRFHPPSGPGSRYGAGRRRSNPSCRSSVRGEKRFISVKSEIAMVRKEKKTRCRNVSRKAKSRPLIDR